ncbi:MAG TPA: type IX secretion system sortase PorU, partial [Segetibacter sp.]
MNSVLSTGTWYKIAVRQEGVYKVDVPFLNSLGINTTSISSNTIRLYGNGGAMLPENNSANRADDLLENSIQVIDGGDGIFNGSDYFIFYSPGPDAWIKDSVNRRFTHQKNLYSDESFYFISIGGTGKRITTKTSNLQPNTIVTSFNERYFHEVDTINFLKSGKEWYGEEFSNTPGNAVSRSFNINLPNISASVPLTLNTNVVARSVGANSRFEVRVNGQNTSSIVLPAVSGNYLDAFATQSTQQSQVNISQGNITLNYTFVPGAFNGQGWLNWFEVFARRELSMAGTEVLTFRDWASVANNNIAQFNLRNTNINTQVWEVTDAVNPIRINGAINGTDLTFQNDANRLREYIAFNGNTFLIARPVGKIETQNLHNSIVADYLIITPGLLRQEAQRLAEFHTNHYGYRVNLTSIDNIYNEFSSGSPDPTAIRDFIKMYYDKAGADTSKRPKYLLLFGDASFDYKNRITNNTNFIPAYQSPNSLDPLTTYTSDDFYGLLDNSDDINSTSPPGLLDIGIGRIPASNVVQAKTFVDKLIRYHQPSSLGPWRNQTTFVADDEDGNLHLQDAELISATAANTNPFLNQYKIYLDAYRQESGSGGSRYPEANQAIINQTYSGNLIWNYNGHGGSQRLADEAILDKDVSNQFNNPNKLPLFITATCDFAPYDDPTLFSIGENLLLGDEKGVIGLTTTTRLVFAFSNRIINNNFLQIALRPDSAGTYLTLGESVRRTKNLTYNSSGDIINNRKFTLLGDPAMKLAIPEWKIKVDTINGVPATGNDTLKALEKYSISGQVTDLAGNSLNSFNGSVYPVIFDKEQKVQTLANDPGSFVTTFNQQSNAVYKGKASVTNGQFSFSFIVPKDINYQVGAGRISLYAENGSK